MSIGEFQVGNGVAASEPSLSQVYSGHRELIDDVWARVEQRLHVYPEPLSGLAAQFLGSIEAHRHEYFSAPHAAPLLFLPIWLAGELPRAHLLDILEATALLYFYVRIQDDVIDEPETRGSAPLLLLGNALIWDARDLLDVIVQDLEFRTAAREAWLRFSRATESERRQIRGVDGAGYEAEAFVAHARKVAMAEIPLYAVLKLTGGWHRAPLVAEFVHLLGRAYGLVNDLRGFERDLSSGMRTFLIDRVCVGMGVQFDDPSAVRAAFITSGEAVSFIEQAQELHMQARLVGRELGLSHIDAYTRERIDSLEAQKQRALLARLACLLGTETSHFDQHPVTGENK